MGDDRDPAERSPAGAATDDLGGDPVCWLHLTCPACGLLLAEPRPPACPRCDSDTSSP